MVAVVRHGDHRCRRQAAEAARDHLSIELLEDPTFYRLEDVWVPGDDLVHQPTVFHKLLFCILLIKRQAHVLCLTDDLLIPKAKELEVRQCVKIGLPK